MGDLDDHAVRLTHSPMFTAPKASTTARGWRGPRTANDPTLSSRAWAKVKNHWIALRLPRCQSPHCVLPGIPINYDPPYTRPNSFSCGHIVDRYRARHMGWTVGQMNALANSRPEHRRCNVRSGARLGQKVQAAHMARVRAQLDESRRW